MLDTLKTKDFTLYSKILDEISNHYFSMPYKKLVHDFQQFIITYWIQIVFDESKKMITVEQFMKKHILKLKLIQPPESL